MPAHSWIHLPEKGEPASLPLNEGQPWAQASDSQTAATSLQDVTGCSWTVNTVVVVHPGWGDSLLSQQVTNTLPERDTWGSSHLSVFQHAPLTSLGLPQLVRLSPLLTAKHTQSHRLAVNCPLLPHPTHTLPHAAHLIQVLIQIFYF